MAVSTPPAWRAPTTDTIRVLTLNLWAQQEPWAARRAVLHAGLRALDPDLVAFQEPIVGDTYDQVRDLLGPAYHILHTQEGLVPDVDHAGASLASRWPLDMEREVNLHLTPRTAAFPCTTLIAEVRAPDPVGALLFVNHLPSWEPHFERERELQTVAVAQVLEELVGQRQRHVVIAGDLDAEPDAASIRFWTGRQSLHDMSVYYLDAWDRVHPGEAGHTSSPRNPLRGDPGDPPKPGRRIDYIFVSCDDHGKPTLEIAGCELALHEPVDDVWASDHFGVVADLVVPARPAHLE